MFDIAYVGMDIHKKTVAWCAKDQRGTILGQGTIGATRRELAAWAASQTRPWMAAMEATLFTGWIYDFLKPHARQIKVAHPLRLRAIATAKKKNDRVDAATLAVARRLVAWLLAVDKRATPFEARDQNEFSDHVMEAKTKAPKTGGRPARGARSHGADVALQQSAAPAIVQRRNRAAKQKKQTGVRVARD